MGLVTRCPKCQSEYEVTADQLKLHDGLVRCGQCSHVFDGFACLKDALPTLTRKASSPPADEAPVTSVTTAPVLSVPAAAPLASPPSHIPSTSPAESTVEPSLANEKPLDDTRFIPSVDRQAERGHAASARQEPALGVESPLPPKAESGKGPVEPTFGSFEPAQVSRDAREPTFGAISAGYVATKSAQTGSPSNYPREDSPPEPRLVGESRVKGDDPSAFGRTVPEFLEDDEEVSEGASVMWLLGLIVLAIALIVQSLVVFRNDIVAATPSFRPLLVQLCKPFACDVSYVRKIEQISIVGSSLQQAPDAAVAGNQRGYVLRLTLQNRAPYPQPWPALMLTLTDASGTAVIKKALLPLTFLPPDLLEGPMTARQEVALDIPLTVDGLNISGYEVERFFP